MNTSHVTTARTAKQDLYVHLSYFNFIVTFLIIEENNDFYLFTYSFVDTIVLLVSTEID